jgi:hypothetical protein
MSAKARTTWYSGSSVAWLGMGKVVSKLVVNRAMTQALRGRNGLR